MLAVHWTITFPETGHTRTAHNHLILLHLVKEIHTAEIRCDCCLNLRTISSSLDHPLCLLKEIGRRRDHRTAPCDPKYTTAYWIINYVWCSHQARQMDSIQNRLDSRLYMCDKLAKEGTRQWIRNLYVGARVGVFGGWARGVLSQETKQRPE